MNRILVTIMIVLVWTHVAASDQGGVPRLPEFTCNLMALSDEDLALYEQSTRSLLAAVQETTELQDGYAFRLTRETLVMAAEWVSFESRCCPFFAFEIEVASDAGPVWLRITGANGVKEFIREELAIVIRDPEPE